MRAHLLVVLALAAPTLAGCIGGSVDPASLPDVASLVSPILYPDMIAEHTPIAMSDGIVIDAFVFRPAVAEGDAAVKVPIIINFSPYWSNLAPPVAVGGDAFSLSLLSEFVPRGYAVALVSARGTGLSEGCFTIGGPVEQRDTSEVVDFLAGLPWSNGNVTATGKSYDGTLAQALLTTGNPHVKTIVPVSPISELYKYNYVNGVPYLVTGHAFNTYYVAETSLSQDAPVLDGDPTSIDPNDPTYEKVPTRMCEEAVDVQLFQVHGFATGDYSPYWQVRNYSALLPEELGTSVFYVHGLQDWNVKTDHMVPWIEELHKRDVTVKMWLGQWTHEYPTRSDWNMTLLRWLDHYLKGIDTGILDEPLVQVEDNEGVWRHEADWPATRASTLTFYPDGDGSLGADPGSGSSSYQDAPVSPLAVAMGGAVFTTTLEEDLRVVGAPVMYARVMTTQARSTLSVILRVDGVIVDEGFLDLAHHGGLATTTPMTPGVPEEVTITLYPQDLVLKKGSTLSVELAHTSPGPAGVAPNPTGAVVTVAHGDATRLVLPVVDLEDVTVEESQPDDVGCWQC